MLRDAVKFISVAMQDKLLRSICYCGSEQGKLFDTLAQAGFKFSAAEFEDAVVQHLFVCKNEDEADNIKQFGLWFRQLSAAE